MICFVDVQNNLCVIYCNEHLCNLASTSFESKFNTSCQHMEIKHKSLFFFYNNLLSGLVNNFFYWLLGKNVCHLIIIFEICSIKIILEFNKYVKIIKCVVTIFIIKFFLIQLSSIEITNI